MRAIIFFRLTMASDQHVHCVAGGGKSVSNGGKRFLQTEEKARLLLNLAIHFEVLELVNVRCDGGSAAVAVSSRTFKI